jgi:hypothetical protein
VPIVQPLLVARRLARAQHVLPGQGHRVPRTRKHGLPVGGRAAGPLRSLAT